MPSELISCWLKRTDWTLFHQIIFQAKHKHKHETHFPVKCESSTAATSLLNAFLSLSLISHFLLEEFDDEGLRSKFEQEHTQIENGKRAKRLEWRRRSRCGVIGVERQKIRGCEMIWNDDNHTR